MKDVLYFAPRALAILFALFVSAFALDVFGEGYTAWETLAALLKHLIPGFILLAALALGWRNDAMGALMFATAGLIFLAQFGNVWLVAGPPFVIAALFAASAFARRSEAPEAGG